MITPSDIYWITRLDNFITVGWIAIILLIALFIAFLCSTPWDAFDNEHSVLYEEARRSINRIKLTALALITILLGMSFIPSTREAAAMYAVPKIVDSSVVKEDLPELYDMGVKALKDWLMDDQHIQKEDK